MNRSNSSSEPFLFFVKSNPRFKRNIASDALSSPLPSPPLLLAPFPLPFHRFLCWIHVVVDLHELLLIWFFAIGRGGDRCNAEGGGKDTAVPTTKVLVVLGEIKKAKAREDMYTYLHRTGLYQLFESFADMKALAVSASLRQSPPSIHTTPATREEERRGSSFLSISLPYYLGIVRAC